MSEPEFEEINDQFDEAVRRMAEASRKNVSDRYAEGVAAALGWVVGQYADKPIE